MNKALMSLLLVLLFFSCSPSTKEFYKIHKLELFGVQFIWQTYSENSEELISKKLNNIEKIRDLFDPDCLYRPIENDQCISSYLNHELFKTLVQLCEEVHLETKGAFNVVRLKANKSYRDYGGVSQGFVLNLLKDVLDESWSADFAGDIFLAKSTENTHPVLSISDPEINSLKIANVTMKTGWMLGSSSPKHGGKIFDPASGELADPDFRRIVLFAKPLFDGGRLDAWSTALIVGGSELLKHLWSLEKYKTTWAYAYVTKDGNLICSDNLKCVLDKKTKVMNITAPW